MFRWSCRFELRPGLVPGAGCRGCGSRFARLLVGQREDGQRTTELGVVLQVGELRVEISPHRITLSTADDGPGIADIEMAFAPGFTTALDWVRELGFGAGMGLTNIKRYSDSVEMDSALGRGTTLRAVFLVGNHT